MNTCHVTAEHNKAWLILFNIFVLNINDILTSRRDVLIVYLKFQLKDSDGGADILQVRTASHKGTFHTNIRIWKEERLQYRDTDFSILMRRFQLHEGVETSWQLHYE